MDAYLHWVHLFQQPDCFPSRGWRQVNTRHEDCFIDESMQESERTKGKFLRSRASLCPLSSLRTDLEVQNGLPQTPSSTAANRNGGRKGEKGGGQAQWILIHSFLLSQNPHLLGRLPCPASHNPTRLHCRHCQECTYGGAVAAGHFSRKSEERFPHVLGIETWPAGLPRPGEGESSDITQPFGSSSCPFYIHIEPDEWLTF